VIVTVEFISEAVSARLLTRALAFASAREAMFAVAGTGVSFPAAIYHGAHPANRISIKAGVVEGVAGVKLGSYWPHNLERGLTRHGSLILLFDEATGRVETIIQASAANAMRTAAVNAVATDALARPDARTVTIFGAGAQAYHEVMALSDVRAIEQVLVVSRNAAKADALIAQLNEQDLPCARASAEAACRAADIIVTVTPANAPLFEPEWAPAGVHISAMGADGPGKQELPVGLLRQARLFCDLPSQSVTLGEFQSVADEVAREALSLSSLGDVLSGAEPGRRSAEEITIFDSSGIALQDVSLGLYLRRAARNEPDRPTSDGRTLVHWE
jgi:ornithine cyclodeaminase